MTWSATDSTIACPFTRISLPVPKAWHADVRRIDRSEIDVLPAPDRLGAVLVRGAQGGISGRALLDDIKRAMELVGFPVPEEIPDDAGADLDEPLMFLDINFQTRLMSSEFGLEPPYAGVFLFRYHLAQKDGAVCRLATLERETTDGGQRLSTVLDGVRAPGLTMVPTRTIPPEDATPTMPAVSCRGWPVWMLPVCTAARRTSSP